MSDPTLEIRMDLQYDHGSGEFGPYFEALGIGRAMARRCNNCGCVWFPPHASCPKDGSLCEWLELDGTGLVTAITKTYSRLPFSDDYADRTFIMVAMSGADNLAFGQLIATNAIAAPGDRVCLVKLPAYYSRPVRTASFELLEEDQ